MFGAFEIRSDADATRRYAITSAIAAVVLAGLVGAAIAFSGQPEEKEEEPDVIDVTFQAPVDEEPVMPTPEVKPQPRPQVKREAPKLVREHTPTKIDDRKVTIDDSNDFQQTATGTGGGDMTAGPDVGGGLDDGLGKQAPPKVETPKPVKKVVKTGPIQLPENATPPRPLPGNTPPAYPEDARASGVEGEVYLKIVINEDGSVGDIEVKKGDEPFVSAAIAVVKAWKYSPALVDGKPTAVYRIIKVPFRLKG